MARYIDADKLMAHLQDEIEGCRKPFCCRANVKNVAYGTMLGLKSAISFVETLSTADVVPKSESEFDSIPVEAAQALKEKAVEKAKAEVAREIFEELYKSVASKIPMEIRPIFKEDMDFDVGFINGKRDALLDVLVLLAELKKKYTERKEDEGK